MLREGRYLFKNYVGLVSCLGHNDWENSFPRKLTKTSMKWGRSNINITDDAPRLQYNFLSLVLPKYQDLKLKLKLLWFIKKWGNTI